MERPVSFSNASTATTLLAAALGAYSAGNSMIVVSREAARFEAVSPQLPKGPAIAVLKGDPATGPSDMLLRMPRGRGRLHTHSSDYRLVIIEGRMKHWAKGETETQAEALGPGSFWYQPANQAHADTCLDEVCLMYISWSATRDAKLAE